MSGLANYYFIPALRQGLAAEIKQSVSAQEGTKHRSVIDIQLLSKAITTDGIEKTDPDPIEKDIQLYGPGDIIGFDPRIVVRTDPLNNVGDFEPNYFPFIEFADPDFPWRFTAKKADDGTGKLWPWLTLIVLKAGEEYKEGDPAENERRPWIMVDTASLPNLTESWRWAHVQITAEDNLNIDPEMVNEKLNDIIRKTPERAVSRLMCARSLHPNTLYHAFVVPTFELGRLAGLGMDLDKDTDALELAWSDEGNIELPYYYKWEFRTGQRGDFEYLIRLLEPRKLEHIGLRKIDCGIPGFGLQGIQRNDVDPPGLHILDLEGALMSINTVFTPWGRDQGYIFCLSLDKMDYLPQNAGTTSISTEFKEAYNENKTLSDDATISRQDENVWIIEDGTELYKIENTGTELAVYDLNLAFPTFQWQLAYEILNKPFRESEGDIFVNPFDNPDDMPPEIGSVTVAAHAKSAVIRWTTSAEVPSRVDYWEADNDRKSESSKARENHWVVLKNLAPEVKYHFQIHTLDEDSNIVKSTPDGSFETVQANPVPSVLPPIYGRWHGAGSTVDTTGDSPAWSDVLNLDPRHRTAAGFGTRVIREQQEPLMASAWDQLGAIEEANELLRRAQLGREGSISILDRFKGLGTGRFLSVLSPVFPRVRKYDMESGEVSVSTIQQIFQDSPIPQAALDPAFRRIQRKRGPIRKRQKPDSDENRLDILPRLNVCCKVKDAFKPAGSHPKPDGMVDICDISMDLINELGVVVPPPPDVGPPPGGDIALDIGTVVNPGNVLVFPSEGLKLTEWNYLRPNMMVVTEDRIFYFNNGGYYSSITGGSSSETGNPIQSSIRTTNTGGIVEPGSNGPGGPPPPELPPVLLCTNCGSQIQIGEPTCPNCGEPVIRPEEPTPDSDEGSEPGSGSVGVIEPFCPKNITSEVINSVLEDPNPFSSPDNPWVGVYNTLVNSGITIDEMISTIDTSVTDWLNNIQEKPPCPPPIDIEDIRGILEEELDPRKTIADRMKKRLLVEDLPESEDQLGERRTELEFPQPMYEPLRDISQDLLAPGIGTVPQNTLGLLNTNGRFIESYMCALNHEFSSELLWRECPVKRNGSFFRQFWDVSIKWPTDEFIGIMRSQAECEYRDWFNNLEPWDRMMLNRTPLEHRKIIEMKVQDRLRKIRDVWKDINPITEWGSNKLGDNDNDQRPGGNGENLVLIIRGDLFKKYPNTVVYAVEAQSIGSNGYRVPKLKEFLLAFKLGQTEFIGDKEVIYYEEGQTEYEVFKSYLEVGLVNEAMKYIFEQEENPILDENASISDSDGGDLIIQDGPRKYIIVDNDIELKIYNEKSKSAPRKFPLFQGTLPPDITFFGFDITDDQARGGGGDDVSGDDGSEGYFFILEERISEARFGMDSSEGEVPPTPKTWDDLSWKHIIVRGNDSIDSAEEPSNGDGEENTIPEDMYINSYSPIVPTDDHSGKKWDNTDGTTSASIAWITLQKPVRIAVHANQMIPD